MSKSAPMEFILLFLKIQCFRKSAFDYFPNLALLSLFCYLLRQLYCLRSFKNQQKAFLTILQICSYLIYFAIFKIFKLTQQFQKPARSLFDNFLTKSALSEKVSLLLKTWLYQNFQNSTPSRFGFFLNLLCLNLLCYF